MTPPAPLLSSRLASTAARTWRTTSDINRLLTGCFLALALPGIVAAMVGSITAAIVGSSTAEAYDAFSFFTPLTRAGLGWVALVGLLFPFLRDRLLRWIPTWGAALDAERRRKVRHPGWLQRADHSRVAIAGVILLTLVFTPASVLAAVSAAWNASVFLVALVVVWGASIPYGALLLFDRPR